MSKPGCHGNVNVDGHVMTTIKCKKNMARKLNTALLFKI